MIKLYDQNVWNLNPIDNRNVLIRSMVEANSYIIIDENDEGYQKDDIVDVVFFDSLLW